MAIKKRNTDQLTLFMQDEDWGSLRAQLLKMVDKINEQALEIVKLKNQS